VPAVPAPGFLQRYWPGPASAAPPVALAAVIASAVVAAVVLPLDRPGLGWLLTGLAAIAATALVARTATEPHRAAKPETGAPGRGPGAGRGWRWFWGTASVGLLGIGSVRAAGWLFVLCALTACVSGSLAVGGGTRVVGLLRGAFALPVAALRALPWLRNGVRTVRRVDGRSPLRTVAVAGLSLVLLLVFGSLFTSADAAFASIVEAGLPDVDAGTVFRWIFVGGVVGLGTLGAAYLVSAPPALDGAGGGQPGRRGLHRWEWAMPLALLDALFVAFVLVQVTVWFGGADHVLETAGLTYAEYARGGFWQLLVVTVLTLAVIGLAARWAPREHRTDRILLRVLPGVLAGLTLVIVASALYRMHVYEQAYGFTRLRVLVSLCELWLGLVFLMVLAAGIRLRAGWLPRAAVASAVLALLGLGALDPDRFIADRNVDRFHAIGRIDTAYLSTLSADAVPALDRLDGEWRDCALGDIHRRLIRDGERDGWHEWNLARTRAREILTERPGQAVTLCGSRR
jgi:hypothetical protein